ncbi:hypothetical protein SNE40_022850 [Patella caerulea]|uniref:Nephrocystin-3 n=1 Tax=Patella caerulea TaxID=87958 RepID=A0AAN8G1M0_PATCE
MGTVGSFLRSNDDDDILDLKIRGRSGGVIKHIPIEMKPRGKLGLGRVGSVGRKPKGGSLRSALSIDLENPETERIKREFEMYRLDKENDIANWQKKEKKLEQENKRMRSELLALQKTCTKLRNERDMALQAEQRAIARAASFECDRDKVQRRFKIYRETAEYELQNVLRDRRNLENKMTKYSPGCEDGDTTSRFLVDGTLGNNNPGDWWSEPSLGSTVQLHQPTYLRGPEFAHTMMELEGPFTNVNKDDWSSALANMSQSGQLLTEQAINKVKRIYISAPQHMFPEITVFDKEYVPMLRLLCQKEGKTLVVVYLQQDNQIPDKRYIPRFQQARQKQLDMASLLVAFVGNPLDRENIFDIKYALTESTSVKPAVIAFKDANDKRMCFSGDNSDGLKLKEESNMHIISEYTSPQEGAEMVYAALDKILKSEHGVAREKTEEDEHTENGLCGGALWDINYDFEQMEALCYAFRSSCELGFEKYYEKLNSHISAAGPYPPLLVMGPSGCGRSLLLSKWVQQLRERNPNYLVLYHFVGKPSSVSADPILMIRRLSSQLMQQINNPPVLTSDSSRLIEDFPRWLEKISSKSPGGTILVLDSIDRFEQAEVHLKWLLDPLPVDARVIVSAEENTCPQVWRSWPTLLLDSFSVKNIKELFCTELSTNDVIVSNENERKILSHCGTMETCTPLYVMIIAAYVISCGGEKENDLSDDIDNLLSTSTCELLYIQIIHLLQSSLEAPENEGMIKLILKYLCVSRNGIEENELMSLIPDLTWTFLVRIFDILSSLLIIKYQAGLITFAHEAAMTGVYDLCFGKDDGEQVTDIRQELIDYHSQFLVPGCVSCRVADELPWLLRQAGDKDTLKHCILNLCIFQRLYERGRSAELLAYWQYLGVDKNDMAAAYFTATKKTEEGIGQYNGLITLPLIADMYETLGRFLKDMVLLNQALPPLQRALEIRETAMDPDHPVVARSLHQLAGLHAQWGKYTTAEALFRQALEIYESAFGFEHNLVAREVESLANLYQKQNKHDLAEPLRKRAISIKKRIKSVKTGQNNAADKLQRRTLHLEELALGPESPDLARTLNELGVLYYLQNDWETSESFFKRSIEMRENLLGKDHLDLAQSLNNLAALYNDKKIFDKAEPLYERALQIRLKHLSPDSAGVSGIVRHLSMLYRKQNKFDKAEPLYKQAVDIREKSFGANHPSVATALVNLAVLYSQQNKYSDAEPAYERALKIYEESLGPHHARVAETLRNLAVMKYEQKDFETAAKLYKRSTEIKENEATYTSKVLSRRSSSGDTNTTIKNILQT